MALGLVPLSSPPQPAANDGELIGTSPSLLGTKVGGVYHSQTGVSLRWLRFVSGKKREHSLLTWTPEDEPLGQNASAAQKLAHERKIGKKEALMETVVLHTRSFALDAIERLPMNMKFHIDCRFHIHR